MPDTDFPITQLEENDFLAAVDTETALPAALAGDDYGVIPAGDIAAVERAIVSIDVSAAGSITFLAGEYGPGIRASQGNLTRALGVGRRSISLESSRFVRPDGTIRFQKTGALRGDVSVLVVPRSKAGRPGQPAIPPNPKPY